MLRPLPAALAALSLAWAGAAVAQTPDKPPADAQNAAPAAPVDPRALLDRLRREADTRPRAGWEAGMMILRGVDPTLTAADAYRIIRRAAEHGDEYGMTSTGVMLATGQGVTENDAEARGWYLRAARIGSAHALRAYGGMLMTGEGGPIELVRGRAYVELAAEAGDVNAVRIVTLLQRMTATDEQRARMDALKAEWRAANPPLH